MSRYIDLLRITFSAYLLMNNFEPNFHVNVIRKTFHTTLIHKFAIQTVKEKGNDFIKPGRTFALLHDSLNWHSDSRTVARANNFET